LDEQHFQIDEFSDGFGEHRIPNFFLFEKVTIMPALYKITIFFRDENSRLSKVKLAGRVPTSISRKDADNGDLKLSREYARQQFRTWKLAHGQTEPRLTGVAVKISDNRRICVSPECRSHGVGSKRAREVVALATAASAATPKKKQKTTAEKKAEMTKNTIAVPSSSSPSSPTKNVKVTRMTTTTKKKKKKAKPVHKDDLLGAPSEFQKSVMEFMRMHGI
jgi:hypothetical protein